MESEDRPAFHESPIPFDSSRVHALAVYCSDGRFGEQFDDLLEHKLGLPRYDRLAIPGGAAALASHFVAHREEQGAFEHLRFLIEAHDITHVVLVAHQDCGFYTERLKVSPLQLETQQREDIIKAIRRVATIRSGLKIEAFFARLHWDEGVHFERVEV